MLEELILTIIALLTGRKGAIEVVREDPWILLVFFISALLAAFPVLLKNGAYKAATGVFGLAGLLCVPLVLPVGGTARVPPVTQTKPKPVTPVPTPVPPPIVQGPPTKPPPPTVPTLPPAPVASPGVRFEVLADMSLSGRSLAPARGMPTAAMCEQLCANDAECVSYVYDRPTQMCQLKAETGSQTQLGGSVAGIKRSSR
jgi:hypothetical protein